MTDSIKVAVRFRRDKEDEELDDWDFDLENNIIKLREKKFVFDTLLDMNCAQDEMYEKVAAKTIEDFTSGYHGTLFAYGNSGSGKTYSIVGPDEIVEFLAKDFSVVPEDIQKLYGVIPRATIAIFNAINEYTAGGATVNLVASYIEIYNETITCLLNGKENLKVQEIPKIGFNISGKEERACLCPEDIFKVLYIGTKNKTTGGTLQNARSSRSHTLLSLEMKVKSADGSERCSKLNIVDLAGSEKLRNTGANTPERIKEAQKINLSLTTLGMCIMALTENNSFVPFRNSKLTLLLKESLGGNSKTTLLCAARRDKKLAEDNLNSLGFAQRAKSIKTKCVKNVKLSDKESEYLVNALKREIVTLRKQVKELGHNFKPIVDTKLLQLLDGDLKDDTGTEDTNTVPLGKPNNSSKRTSLINLSEEEIIYKYCELRAKYDNLIENAGNRIWDLSEKVSNSGVISEEQLKEMNQKTEEVKAKLKAEYDEEIKRLEEKIEFERKQKKNLEEELKTAKDDANGLQEMLDLNGVDIENMSSQIDEKEKEVKSALKEKEDLQFSLSVKDKEIAARDGFIEDYKKQIQELNNKLSEAEGNLSSQTQVLKEKEMNISSLNEEVLNLKSSQEDYIKKLQTAQQEIETLTSQLLESRNKNEELQNNIINKESSIFNLTAEVENLKKLEKEKISDQDVFAHKDKLFTETKKVLEDRINQLNDQLNLVSKQSSDAKADLSNQVKSLNNDLDALKAKNSDLEFEVKQKSNELANIKQLRDEAVSAKDSEILSKSNELNEVKYQLLEKEKEYHSQVLKVEEQVFSKNSEIQELKDQVEAIRKELDSTIKSKDNEITNLQRDKANNAKQVEDLNGYVKKLEDDISSLEAKIKELKNIIDSLETKNKELQEVS
jgi:chromosome segregation ATPase